MAKAKKAKLSSTQAALENLDRVFHEKARLGILTTMVGCPDGLNFNELKDLCGLTDGNLNRHLKVLADANIVGVKKSGQGRNTNSVYKLTASGKRAFQQYIDSLEAIVRQAQGATSKSAKSNLGLAGN
jgi:DNA-binding HxlR family transcriptional regulator